MQNQFNPINTTPIQSFANAVKAAEISNQREVRLDIKTAKLLASCLLEVNAKLAQDYSKVIAALQNSVNNTTTTNSVSMDGGRL